MCHCLGLVGLDVIVLDLLGSLVHLVKQVTGLAGGFVDHAVKLRLVLQEGWTDDFCIDDGRAVVLDGRHAPDHEDALGQPVEGDPPGQNVGKKL